MNGNTKIFAAWILAFASVGVNISAEEGVKVEQSVTLTVEQAVDYAIKNSRTLKSADIDLELKERAAKNGWNVLLPTVQVAGTMSRSTEYSPSSAGTVAAINGAIMMNHGASSNLLPVKTDYDKEEDRWATVGSVSIGWNFSLAMLKQIKASKVAYEGGKISLQQSTNEQVLSIKKLFYALLLQQESLKIQKATLENSRQRMVQAQTNFRNGLVPELKYLQTQVDYENKKPDVDTAEQNLNNSIDTLVFLIGMPVGTKVSLEGEIDPKYIEADADKLIEQYGHNSLEIQSLENNVEALKENMGAIDLSTWTPALAINYSWQPAYIGPDGAFHFFKGIGKDDQWYDSGSLSFTLAWNLTNALPWSSNQQKAKDLKQNLLKLEISLDMLKENQKVAVRKAVDTLNQAKAQIEAMERNVGLAQRAYDMTYRAYRNGTTELLDLRDSEQSLNQAKLGLVNQKYNYMTALLDLENTLNADLTSGRR